jgi:SAM-dependent methyltransferase
MSDPSPAYAGRVKYTPAAASRYQSRKPAKHKAEMALVERAARLVPRGTFLDAPCGGARVALLLASLGYHVTAADLSYSMVKIATQAVKAAEAPIVVHQKDLEALDYPDRNFDSVICFRLFHHFPNCDIRSRVIGELCRVARKHVLLSYFSPVSFTAVKRQIQEHWMGQKRQRFHTPLSEVEGYFELHGFKLLRDFAQFRYFRTLHLAVFQREN